MTTKIGLITDMHAELASTQAALDLLARQNVDRVLCSGDISERGVDGDAVVQLIQARDIPTVQGNHDRDARPHQRFTQVGAVLNIKRMKDRALAAATLNYLDKLPKTLRYDIEGVRVLVAHGVPWSSDTFLFPRSPRRLFKRVAREAAADVVVLGHTHITMCAYVDGVWILNPGSVAYAQSWGSGTCATLDLPACIFNVFDLRTGRTVEVPQVKMS